MEKDHLAKQCRFPLEEQLATWTCLQKISHSVLIAPRRLVNDVDCYSGSPALLEQSPPLPDASSYGVHDANGSAWPVVSAHPCTGFRAKKVCKNMAFTLDIGETADAETTVKLVHLSKEDIPTSLDLIFTVSLNGADLSFLPSPFCSSFAISAGNRCSWNYETSSQISALAGQLRFVHDAAGSF